MSPISNIAKQIPLTSDEMLRLRKLYELSMTLAGDPMEVFSHAARLIGELLDVKVVCLSEVRGKELYFLAVYVNGQVMADAGQCPLEITPCSTVEQSKDFRIYERVQELFPEASFLAQHNAFSYCGFPALDNTGNVVAVTCLLDDKPHAFSHDDEEILRIFGQRIGMEIERHRYIKKQQAAERELRAYRDELEKLVKARTAQLAATNQELESFSYSVSHDLRAPLRAIDGFSQALQEEYNDKLDVTGQEYLARIRNGAHIMGALIDDLLKLSRLSRTPMLPEEVDLSEMAREIVEQLRATAPDRTLQIEIEPGLQVKGDPGLLRVALDNLLGNAWKYTAKNPNARIEFTRASDNGNPAFCVRDNGVGFDMKYASRLFGAFQRLHHRDEFEGTGIGLATVQRIVHRHGGRVWAEAAPGQGATFYFTLGQTTD